MPSRTIYVGNKFWNIRGSFYKYCFDIGTQMSIVCLTSMTPNKYLIIDAVDLNNSDKDYIDYLTQNGTLIEAVLLTHPFHTESVPNLLSYYPNVKYYGTPRHLRMFPSIKWAGDLTKHMKDWENDGIFLKIPYGTEIDPQSPKEEVDALSPPNAMGSIWVFHQPSGTLHVNDTLCVFNKESDNWFFSLCCCIYPNDLFFWPFLKKGLATSKEAPKQFQKFIEEILQEWEFNNLVVSHNGILLGNAKQAIRDSYERTKPKIQSLDVTNK
jgi:hypothetical protein